MCPLKRVSQSVGCERRVEECAVGDVCKNSRTLQAISARFLYYLLPHPLPLTSHPHPLYPLSLPPPLTPTPTPPPTPAPHLPFTPTPPLTPSRPSPPPHSRSPRSPSSLPMTHSHHFRSPPPHSCHPRSPPPSRHRHHLRFSISPSLASCGTPLASTAPLPPGLRSPARGFVTKMFINMDGQVRCNSQMCNRPHVTITATLCAG